MPKSEKTNKNNTPSRVETKIANSKARLLEALKDHHGIVTKACEVAGFDRTTYYAYYNTDPAFAEAADDVIEQTVDVAESVVWGLMLGAEDERVQLNAAKIMLDAKGKKRGFGTERREQKHEGGIALSGSVEVVRYELPNNGTEGDKAPMPPGWETAAG